MWVTKKYGEDNQISNFGCPPTTTFRSEFCYPAILYLTQIHVFGKCRYYAVFFSLIGQENELAYK